MDKVSDILAFAAAHGEYWTQFLTNDDYGSELSANETRALEAARVHLGEGIYDLLVECGRQLVSRLSDRGVTPKNSQRGATVQNRRMRIYAPPKAQKWLYGLDFCLEPEHATGRVLLYGYLTVSIKAKDDLLRNIEANRIECFEDGYWIWNRGFALDANEPFSALAERASADLAQLFLAADGPLLLSSPVEIR